ncbi:MAG: cytochrome-c peroxidase [Actinomycetota bacterium]
MLTKKLALKLLSITVFLVFVGFISVCKQTTIETITSQKLTDSQASKRSDEPILPIPSEIKLNSEKVALGEKLFNDVQFSHDNTISCATCHSLDLGGTDQRKNSIGINGQIGEINAPTVFNTSLNFKQFWDGRAETLEDQIDGPTHASGEMGSNWEEIIEKLNSSPEYVSVFAALYDNGIQTQNIKDAIAEFERSLLTPNSRFDRYLKGEKEMLTKDEKEGYRTFKTVGCVSCHQGINVGGNLFQEFGVMGEYFKDRGNLTKADLGRYNVTKNEYDRYVFKVPSLRNIARTFPYFHDGSAKSLENAVEVMSKYQLGRKLSRDEIDSIVKFLKTLNGEYKRYPQS